MPNTEPDAAELIREIRRRLNVSQEKLAQRLKVSFPTMPGWEGILRKRRSEKAIC